MIPLSTINGKKVLFSMAASPEYGTELKARFEPFWTGVGPVESAIHMGDALARCSPDLVVCLGSAGSAKLEQTKVYQVSSVAYRDMDAQAFGFEAGITPFLDQPAEIPMPLAIPNWPSASLSTGAAVIAGAAYAQIAQDMVDMESFAVLRACQRGNVPMIGLRGISDGADTVSQYSDWTEYLEIIDGHLAQAVDALSEAITNKTLDI